MRRFNLGMSINYCRTFGVVESVRELFQNAFDAQTANPANAMYFDYDEATKTLRVGNKDGFLSTKTLLLGQTSKIDDNRMIGQHGEDYKVATVVLLRNGKTVKVYNRNDREVWTAKIIKSRRYQADVVVFDIQQVSIFKSVSNHDLIFEVGGITKDEYSAIVESNLHLQSLNKDYVIQANQAGVFSVGNSRVLTDDAHTGKLYVGGLFVTSSKYARLGYDFDPSLVKLDRDRSFIDGLDLQFLCGKVLCATNVDVVRKYKDTWDGQYIRLYVDTRLPSADLSKLYDESYNKFLEENGEDAVPCTTTESFNQLKRNGYNAVLVTDNQYHYISSSGNYLDYSVEGGSNEKLADQLETWFSEYIDEGSEAYDTGKAIIDSILERLRE